MDNDGDNVENNNDSGNGDVKDNDYDDGSGNK